MKVSSFIFSMTISTLIEAITYIAVGLLVGRYYLSHLQLTVKIINQREFKVSEGYEK